MHQAAHFHFYTSTRISIEHCSAKQKDMYRDGLYKTFFGFVTPERQNFQTLIVLLVNRNMALKFETHNRIEHKFLHRSSLDLYRVVLFIFMVSFFALCHCFSIKPKLWILNEEGKIYLIVSFTREDTCSRNQYSQR